MKYIFKESSVLKQLARQWRLTILPLASVFYCRCNYLAIINLCTIYMVPPWLQMSIVS